VVDAPFAIQITGGNAEKWSLDPSHTGEGSIIAECFPTRRSRSNALSVYLANAFLEFFDVFLEMNRHERQVFLALL
jgi:hypothetical protein